MAQNMYRVGDYVYFEISSAAPYQVRRIEELNKTPTGNVEAKVLCYYRRRDISPALLKIADRAECVEEKWSDFKNDRFFYYRRRDISPALLKIADRAECVEEKWSDFKNDRFFYYRRRDISPALLKIADRAECVEESEL
ncbi:Metastasis-associated protein MTA3 [Toxocara canis]|uniref:Metastasis-associated protein MTA3 n=1 Tax=Toxocara canis TaxID=6265 RepID=A0A0B2V0S8_TOXCA|nr:Metastasis-associated protein MTA3 [Toxocara canis]